MTYDQTLAKSSILVTRPARGQVSGDGVELAFGYWPGRSAPVVALHGLTASHLNFIGIAERLAGRCALFALDLRGRGDSDKPEAPYGMSQHARDVAAAMHAMGLEPSIVVGHSMGAFVATALAAQEPGLVSGLVLIDGDMRWIRPLQVLQITPWAPRSPYASPACVRPIPHARPTASSGGRSRISLRKNGIHGSKLSWTMKSAASRPCSRKRPKRECAPI